MELEGQQNKHFSIEKANKIISYGRKFLCTTGSYQQLRE